MFPFKKTIETLIKIKPLWMMTGCAFLGFIIAVASVTLLTWLSNHIILIPIPFLGAAVHAIIGGIFTIAGWFMLPVLIILIAGLFKDEIIYRVERVDYHEPPGKNNGLFWSDLKHDLRFTCMAAGLNMVILPAYLTGIGPFLSVILNSYLLGSEFFEAAAGFHIGKTAASELRKKNRWAVYLGGFMITCLTLVPVLNLFMPIIAVIWMVHVYHHVKGETAP